LANRIQIKTYIISERKYHCAALQYFCGELSFGYVFDLHKCNFLVRPDAAGPVALFINLDSHVIDSLTTKCAATGI
jgi:hypothetical protein